MPQGEPPEHLYNSAWVVADDVIEAQNGILASCDGQASKGRIVMLRAYRLIYLHSPHAPPKLWEGEQPWIHNLIVNARSFNTTRVEQRYFRDWDALTAENSRIWEEHYRSRPLYDPIETWEEWLTEYRQLIIEVQDIHDANPDWRSPESTRL